MTRFGWLALLPWLGVGAFLGCNALLGLGDLEETTCPPACDAGSDVSGEADAPGDSGPSDAGDTASPGDGSADVVIPCTTATKGTALVSMGAYCIDRTEVTVEQYSAFTDSVPKADVATSKLQHPKCVGWNDSFFSASKLPLLTTPQNPMVGIDWCDAWAYCKWAGKYLCGEIPAGGMVMGSKIWNPAADQWQHACSNGGTTTFPYGSTFDPTTCNTGVAASAPVGSRPGCVNANGVADLSGNVDEWSDNCWRESDAGSSEDQCALRGGSYAGTDGKEVWCSAPDGGELVVRLKKRGSYHDTLGFRCCWSP